MNNTEMIENAKNTWPEFFEADTLKLDNGERLIRRYDKYQPGLAFLVSDRNVMIGWLDRKIHHIDLNLSFDAHDVYWMPGDFWISKKGTRCFRPNEDGKHILIKTGWGGCFESSRGTEYAEVKELAIYAKRASSNGGGCGGNYYVFPRDFRRELTEDDI